MDVKVLLEFLVVMIFSCVDRRAELKEGLVMLQCDVGVGVSALTQQMRAAHPCIVFCPAILLPSLLKQPFLFAF